MKLFNMFFGYNYKEKGEKSKTEEEKNEISNSDKILNEIKNAHLQINDMTEQINNIAKNLSGAKSNYQKDKNISKKNNLDLAFVNLDLDLDNPSGKGDDYDTEQYGK